MFSHKPVHIEKIRSPPKMLITSFKRSTLLKRQPQTTTIQSRAGFPRDPRLTVVRVD